MQRDIEFEIHDVDKSGGFIGALYLNKTENAAITLVREGLATVHSYSADSLAWAKQLYNAEVGQALFRAPGSCSLFLRRKRQRRISVASGRSTMRRPSLLHKQRRSPNPAP